MSRQWILAGVLAVVLIIAGVIVYAAKNGGIAHLPGWVPGQSYVANVQVQVTRTTSSFPIPATEFRVKINNVSYDYGLVILSQTSPLILEADVKIVLSSYDNTGKLIDSTMKQVTLGAPWFGDTVESYTMTVKLGDQRGGRTIKAILYPPSGTNILSQNSWVTT